MDRVHNLPVLAADLKEQADNEMSAATMAKCTASCFMSMQEAQLLPTEERCLRNCFVKSDRFNAYFDGELKYVVRNLQL